MRTCKLCSGTGILYDRDAKSPTFGELVLCTCVEKKCACGGIAPYQAFDESGVHGWCSCRSARMKLAGAKRAFREAQIPKKYLWKFIDDFKKLNPVADTLVGMISVIRDTPAEEKWNRGFYLWGNAGSGKTLLAAIILQELMVKYGVGGKFVDLSRQFFQRLKNTYDSSSDYTENAGDILDELIHIPFLVIDDFGVQRNTEWESEMLYNLIDSRYSDERIIIVTSNFHINKFKDVAQGRIYSRILEMCSIIHVDLPDYRESLSRDISNLS